MRNGMDHVGSPILPRASCTGGQHFGEGRWSQLPLVQLLLRGVGYLPSLPPNTSQNSVCLLGPQQEAGGDGWAHQEDSSVAALVTCEDVEVAVCPRVVSGNALQDDVPGGERGAG